MAQASKIEWTESTWNPVVGCTRVSAGCKNCYAERMAKRLAAMAAGSNGNSGRKVYYQKVVDSRGRWNGRVVIVKEALEDPVRWRRPRIVFVNSMSDLFHEKVPLEFIEKVFEVMRKCPRHVFQVLTKRPERAAEFSSVLPWAPNIWLGATVENADVRSRVGYLRSTGSCVRFLSVEPLLGPIPNISLRGIHWVIVGGESGPGARPVKPAWIRQIRDRCIEYEVPFFFKQWGGVNKKKKGRILDGRTWDEMPARPSIMGERADGW